MNHATGTRLPGSFVALPAQDLQLREMATHVTWSPRKESDGIWNDLKAYA